MLGIVTGLTAEARVAAQLGAAVAGGGHASGALQAAERLVARGATALLSFGLAGGLDAGLRPGDILVPQVVIDAGGKFLTEASLRARLGKGCAWPVLAGTQVIGGAGYKALLHRETGACGVDLESGAVARVAARRGLPFAVLRAVCDPAALTLTPAALAGVNTGGGVTVLRVIAALLRQPGEMQALLTLAGDAAAARKSLIRRVDEIRFRGGLML